MDEETDPSKIEHPKHYNTGNIEVWDAILDWQLSFCSGTAVKHIARAGKKDEVNKKEDLRKAVQYLLKEIYALEGGTITPGNTLSETYLEPARVVRLDAEEPKAEYKD